MQCVPFSPLDFLPIINKATPSQTHTLLSRQSLPNEKPIDQIVLAPSISRALILCGIFPYSAVQFVRSDRCIVDRQIHFYTLPALDVVSHNLLKPIRNVVTFAVDEQHLKRPPQFMNDIPVPVEPIEFCVIKRSAVSLYTLRERLFFQKVLFAILFIVQYESITMPDRKYHSRPGVSLHDVQENTSALPTEKIMA